jgi:TolA-binding protein
LSPPIAAAELAASGAWRSTTEETRPSAPKGAQSDHVEEVKQANTTAVEELAVQLSELQARVALLEAPPESRQLRELRRVARSSPTAKYLLGRERVLGGARW